MKIAHLADIHFGKIATPDVVGALLADVRTRKVDLVVVAGDLTQRARPREYRQAVSLLQAFGVPVLVVPGNHDVYPWWYPFHRLFVSLGRYRKYITRDLSPSWEKHGVAVLGINSASGWTIQRGWCRPVAQERIRDFFASRPPEIFRILVVHHPLVETNTLDPRDVAIGGRATLQEAVRANVDLVMCGHWHLSHTEVLAMRPDKQVVVVLTGTATSNRWRPPQEKTNQYHTLEIFSGYFVVEERRYNPELCVYEGVRQSRFERSRCA